MLLLRLINSVKPNSSEISALKLFSEIPIYISKKFAIKKPKSPVSQNIHTDPRSIIGGRYEGVFYVGDCFNDIRIYFGTKWLIPMRGVWRL
jgi:hypothetical protein